MTRFPPHYNLSSTRISSLMHLHLVQNIPIPIMIAYIPYAYVMLTGCVWPTIVQFSILLQFTGEKRYIHFVVMELRNIRQPDLAISEKQLLQSPTFAVHHHSKKPKLQPYRQKAQYLCAIRINDGNYSSRKH